MQKLLLFFLTLFTNTVSFSQSYYPYQDIKLEKPSDYKETEPIALSAATFLLSTPYVSEDMNRSNALKFMISWVEGSKSTRYNMQGVIQDIRETPELLSIYFAAMVKYGLENKDESISPMMIEHNACRLVLAYCNNPANKFKLSKKMRKKLEKPLSD